MPHAETEEILLTQMRLLCALGLNEAEAKEVMTLTTAYAMAHMRRAGTEFEKSVSEILGAC